MQGEIQVDKRVSIITPCFNGEYYIRRYMESILNQTYSAIELIIINDGSTDNTEKIVWSYRERLKDRGFTFQYIAQENNGQASALNRGLNVFTGDYLTWPDSDDSLDPYSIEKKVLFLEQNPQYGFVRSDAYLFNEKDLNHPIGYISRKCNDRFKEELFEDLIMEKNVYFAPGCYLAKSVAFFDVIPKKQIYTSRGGQNWQMLLPLAFKYKCGYIDEPLYNYTIRQTSHSHNLKTKETLLNRCDEQEDILLNTTSALEVNKEYYHRMIKEKYLHKKLLISGIYRDKVLAEKYYSELKEMGSINPRDRKSLIMSENFFLNFAIRGLSKIKRMLVK